MSGDARRVAINSAAPLAANLAGRLLSWALAAVIARKLGPEGTGAYALAVNLWLYASIIADFGLGTWLTREIARTPSQPEAREALGRTLGFRLFLSLLAIPLLAGAALIATAASDDRRIVWTVLLLGLGLLPGAYSAAGTALFNAHERMTFPAAVSLLSGTLTTVVGVAVLLLGYDFVALGWVSLAVNLVTAGIFAAASARRLLPLSASFNLRGSLALARDALPLMLNSLLNSVFFRIDVQVLQQKGSAVVGYYTSAYKVIDATGTVPSSFVLALFPLLSRRAATGDPHPLATVYQLALKLLLAAALPLTLAITFWSRELTGWLWGRAFLPDSAIALSVLIWFLPLSWFNGLTQYVLIAAGLQRRITVAFAITAVVNLAANLVFIPRYGYVAAAIVTIASEVVLLVPFLIALRRRLPLAPVWRAIVRLVPAVLAMGLTLTLLSASRLAGFLVALAVYSAALWLTRVFDESERRVLASLIPQPKPLSAAAPGP